MGLEEQKTMNMDIKHKFVVKELSFINREKTDKNFQVKPIFAKKINKINEFQYEVSVKCEIKDSQDNPFPFDATVVISLETIFGKDIKISDEELNYYLNVTSIQILFPYLRSTLTSLTSAGMVNPLVLPIINVDAFAKSLNVSVDESK